MLCPYALVYNVVMTGSTFDDMDARILDLIQREFPLVGRPFDVMAARLGVTSVEVMERIARLKSERVIRQISAIFDSAALGYSGALAAFRVRPELVDQVAEKAALHKGVSHCYSRDADFNLWFTITLAPKQNPTHEVEALSRVEGVEAHVVLPALRVFKIGVFFDVGGGDDGLKHTEERKREASSGEDRPSLTEDDIKAVRALQKDLPIVDRPFSELAAGVGMSEDELLSRAARLLETRAMRRYAAVLRHQHAGYRSNAMVCWRAEAQEIERVGDIFASHPSVSHCYERAVCPDWPYPLYTMVHSRDDDELKRTIAELAESSGLSDFRVLRSVKEYKKSRVIYFD